MSEILKNTGARLWSLTDDRNELQTSVFEQLTGVGGKSNFRLVDEAIGVINGKLNGYYFEFSEEDHKLYICKKDENENIKKYAVSLTDDSGNIALSVDGDTITIDQDGVLHGNTKIDIDSELSDTSTNPVENKIIKSELDDIKTALSTLNGDGEGSITKAVADAIAQVVADAPEDFDTLKEISDWISGHSNDAATMNSAIQENKKNIESLEIDKADKSDLTNHIDNTDIHVTSSEKNIVSKLGTSDDGNLIFNGKEIKSADLVVDTVEEAQSAIDSGTVKNGETIYVRDTSDDGNSGNSGNTTIDIATVEKVGIVKPDGTTITIDSDGTIKVEGFDDLKKSVSDGKTAVANAITDKGVDTATDASFATMAENISKIETGIELHGAVINVSTEVESLIGKDVVLSKGETTIETKQFDSNGACSFLNIQEVGEYTLHSNNGSEDFNNSVEIIADNIINKTVVSCELSDLKIVTFADGTDGEISKMIDAHYNDKINISDYWAVGDVRTVHLSAMEATDVGESHREQDVQFVILDFDHDELAESINGHTTAAISLGQKDCLMDATNASNLNNGSTDTERGYINSTKTNVGGWRTSARRTWCNNVFFAVLPSIWQAMVKTVNKNVSVGNKSSTIETVQDKIFLAAEIELFGSTTYSFVGEGTQYQYYKNATANIYKMPKYSSTAVSQMYWVRSPYKNDNTHFCNVVNSGKTYYDYAYIMYGIAPCLCI